MSRNLAIALIVFVLSFFSCCYLTGFLVVFQPQPDFELTANPISIGLDRYKGSSNSTVISVGSINDFNGTITFAVELQAVIGYFDLLYPSEITLMPNGQADFVLDFYVPSAVAPGKYPIDIIACSGQLEHTVRVIITVKP